MIRIRVGSFLFNVLFWLWTGLYGMIALPYAVVSWRCAARVSRLWARVSLWLLRGCCGIRADIRGLEHRVEGAALYASKHQSAWDTLIFHVLLQSPSYVMKQELLRLPVFGWYLRMIGSIAINRQGGGGALRRMLKAAKQIAADGRPLVIYPEGTRTRPGKRVEYLPGVAVLYQTLQVPVVPVALDSGHYWPKRGWLKKRPGVIRLELLPPIAPGLSREEFLKTLEAAIEETVAGWETEAGNPPWSD